MTAAEQEPADAPAPDRPREAQSPKPVVVGYDGSPSASAAVDWAAAAAAQSHTGVRVLTAVDYSSVPVWPGASTEYLRDVALERATAVADEGVSRALSVGPGVQASSFPATGGAAGALVEASRQASLLVLGRAEHGAFTSALLGARSLTVIAHAVCPVVLVPTGPALPPGPGRPVVVGVDGSTRGRLGRDVRGRPGGHLEGTAHGHLGLAGASQRDVGPRVLGRGAPRHRAARRQT